MTTQIIQGDSRQVLATLPDASVQCCVTSPPYFGLRDYGCAGQIGLEQTPDEYVAQMVAVFREVRRVLRDDGTLWLNIGDSYANDGKWGGSSGGKHSSALHGNTSIGRTKVCTGLKPKDLIGIPWLLAFALRADGWYLRQDIIWHKPNPMPESVRDRCTKSHEYVFLLTKSARYFYDASAIAEPLQPSSIERLGQPTLAEQRGSDRVPGKTNGTMKAVGPRFGGNKYGDDGRDEARTKSGNVWTGSEKRNARSVWTIATQPFSESHFATMAPDLAERCIKAGSRSGDTILDPFGGAGTTALVADRLQRNATLIELNPEYIEIAKRRLHSDGGLFAEVA